MMYTNSSNDRFPRLWPALATALVAVVIGLWLPGPVALAAPPSRPLEIGVVARQWSWEFRYPSEGVRSTELVVPVDASVTLELTSDDVPHSFVVPELRIDQAVVPGQKAVVVFEATKVGTFELRCTKDCGRDHAQHVSRVIVKTAADYRVWEEQGGVDGDLDSKELGAILYKRYGCDACHSADGRSGVGPSFKGLHGKTELLADGARVVVDDAYIAESIRRPAARTAAGFAPVMPAFEGLLNARRISALVEYIKSLR